MLKRNRSVEEKTSSNYNHECKDCNYKSKSKWALKAHINHKHKEPTSPNEKKPKISSEVVNNILSEVVNKIPKEYFTENKKKTAIEPTKHFLTNTAATLAEMLDDIADQIEVDNEDEDDDTEELEDRLDILTGDKPRNKKWVDDKSENTLVTLPLEDVEELRRKLRNMEDINEDLMHRLEDYEELGMKFKNLESTNEELAARLKDLEEKSVVQSLLSLFVGGNKNNLPASWQLRGKILEQLLHSRIVCDMAPWCVKLIFESLFGPGT